MLDQQALADGETQSNVRFTASATVVFLSDGENASQVDPVALADVAAQVGVRIDAIGLGSATGGTIEVDGFQIATQLDEALLQQVAASSNGTYFNARTRRSSRRCTARSTSRSRSRASVTRSPASSRGSACEAVGNRGARSTTLQRP